MSPAHSDATRHDLSPRPASMDWRTFAVQFVKAFRPFAVPLTALVILSALLLFHGSITELIAALSRFVEALSNADLKYGDLHIDLSQGN